MRAGPFVPPLSLRHLRHGVYGTAPRDPCLRQRNVQFGLRNGICRLRWELRQWMRAEHDRLDVALWFLRRPLRRCQSCHGRVHRQYLRHGVYFALGRLRRSAGQRLRVELGYEYESLRYLRHGVYGTGECSSNLCGRVLRLQLPVRISRLQFRRTRLRDTHFG